MEVFHVHYDVIISNIILPQIRGTFEMKRCLLDYTAMANAGHLFQAVIGGGDGRQETINDSGSSHSPMNYSQNKVKKNVGIELMGVHHPK